MVALLQSPEALRRRVAFTSALMVHAKETQVLVVAANYAMLAGRPLSTLVANT